MLKWGFIFLVIALIAGLFGFTGVAGAAAFAAKVIFGIAILLFLFVLVMALLVTPKT